MTAGGGERERRVSQALMERVDGRRTRFDPGEAPPQTAPHNLEAERAVLGAILLEPVRIPRAIELLTPEEFYKEGHRKIYAAMVRLFEQSEPADVLTVAEELKRAGELEERRGR